MRRSYEEEEEEVRMWEGFAARLETSKVQIELTNRWMWRISIHHRQSQAPCVTSRRVFRSWK